VAVVGDSYVRQLEFHGPTRPTSTVALTRSLVDQGWQGHVDGLSGWPTAQIRALAGRARNNGAHGVAVVAGVNDVAWSVRQPVERVALARVRADVRAVLATTTSARCLVWPTVAPGPRTANRANRAVRAVNETLRTWALRHDNTFVPEWGRALRSHPQWINADGIHLAAAGERELQTLLLGTLRHCLGA
jgi:hypothetical protein